MTSKVWTVEREDAVGIFLNDMLARKRMRGNAKINSFVSIKAAKEYLGTIYSNNSRYDLNGIECNRLLYAEKEER